MVAKPKVRSRRSTRQRGSRRAEPLTAPVKVAPPRLPAVYPRTRLFRELDAARDCPVVWVSAPAGYGKTTLAASYLAARKVKPLWYRLDERDDDPAAFFYYLRRAVMKLAPRKRETLSFLTPEYLPGLPVFARNFFDAVYKRLRTPAVLVLDDYHNLADAAVLQELLPKVFAAAPPGVSIFVLSRSKPPPSFAQLRANQLLHMVGTEALALTLDEVRGFARLHNAGNLSARTLEALYGRVHGWAAAWTLLLARSRTDERAATDIPVGARETLFDYFAAELFDHAAPGTQELLLKIALLPQVPVSVAENLTRASGAAETLAQLERRNYFLTRLTAEEPLYQFHPLFREFLLARLRKTLPAPELRAAQREAARLLSERGEREEAVGLLIESADWDALSALILLQAPALAGQGRVTTLKAWIQTLPLEKRQRDPWFEYWLGVCQLAYDPPEAHRHFERAYEGFRLRKDGRGLYYAWSGAVHPIMLATGCSLEVDHWLEELTTLEHSFPLSHYPEVEAQVAYAALSLLSASGAGGSQTSPWVERMETLLRIRAGDEGLELLLLNGLNVHYFWTGAIEDARATRERLLRRLTTTHVDPVMRLQCHTALVVNSWFTGDLEFGAPLAEAGLRIGEDIGVRMFEHHFASHAFYLAEQARDLEGAEAALRRCAQSVHPNNRVDEGQDCYMAWSLAWHRGDLALARECGERLIAQCEQMPTRFILAHARLSFAQVLVECSEFERALCLRDQAREFAMRANNSALLAQADLTEAWIALRQGDAKTCAAALAKAFAFMHRLRCTIYMSTNARMMGPLCEFALAHAIEPDYARFFIRKWHLFPSHSGAHLESWPWLVKVHTLGRFAVRIDDKPLKFTIKAQKKPLELLKALVAFGGREVSEQRLCDALWPDAEADRARQNLKATLHRVRKLIGPQPVTVEEGKLSFDATRCWIDAWVFERRVNAALEAPTSPPEALAAAVDAALKLYRGPFLAGDEFHFALGTRERLRGKVLRAVRRLTEALRSQGAPERSIQYAEKGLDLDPLAEPFYQELMRADLALGRRAEALAVYNRCRRQLQASLGVPPAPATEALRKQATAP